MSDEDYDESASEEAEQSLVDEAVSALLNTSIEPAGGSSGKKRKNDSDGGDDSHTASKRKESLVWRFYEKNVDRTKTCKVCEKVFSVNTATGAMRKHLTSHFGDQCDKILATAVTAAEVTISPATNMVTIMGLPSSDTETIITTTPLQGKAVLVCLFPSIDRLIECRID